MGPTLGRLETDARGVRVEDEDKDEDELQKYMLLLFLLNLGGSLNLGMKHLWPRLSHQVAF